MTFKLSWNQASELEIQRKEIKNTKRQTVCRIICSVLFLNFGVEYWFFFYTQLEILGRGTGKNVKELEDDMNRPKYFNPWEAVEYGLIDQVLENLAFQLLQFDLFLCTRF